MQTNFELVNTQWFDETALRLPNYKVGRVNYGNGRSYIRLNEDRTLENPFRLYTSLTTAINSCAPMERGLLEWYCKNGLAEADRLLKESQHYGTLMHLLIGQYLTDNYIDLDTIETQIDIYLSENNYFTQESRYWPDKLRSDLAAFIYFAQVHKIEPIGIEYVLLSDKGFGTLIDLVCRMQIEEKGFYGEIYKSGDKKDQPKETKQWVSRVAVINFKSGRHAFYRSNGIQIECEKQLFEENFPDIKIDCALNWSPKEWTIFPDYNLKDWSGEIEQKEVEAILDLAQVRFADKAVNKKYIQVHGKAYKHIGIEANISRPLTNQEANL